MISKILKYIRKSKGLKQDDLAKKCNIAVSTISGYETNYSQPSFEMIERIANECDFEIKFVHKKTGEVITTRNIDRLD